MAIFRSWCQPCDTLVFITIRGCIYVMKYSGLFVRGGHWPTSLPSFSDCFFMPRWITSGKRFWGLVWWHPSRWDLYLGVKGRLRVQSLVQELLLFILWLMELLKEDTDPQAAPAHWTWPRPKEPSNVLQWTQCWVETDITSHPTFIWGTNCINQLYLCIT